MSEFQPRWAAYLRRTNQPTTWDFMAWTSRHWRAWEALNHREPYSPKSKADHDAFDAWLIGQP